MISSYYSCSFPNTHIHMLTILQADEDHDNGDETWDPDSDMDVDVERYFNLYSIYFLWLNIAWSCAQCVASFISELVPSKVKKEIVEPQLNDLVRVSLGFWKFKQILNIFIRLETSG